MSAIKLLYCTFFYVRDADRHDDVEKPGYITTSSVAREDDIIELVENDLYNT